MSDPIGFAMQVDLRLGEENGDLILVVRDNGKGITEEHFRLGRRWGFWECESCWGARSQSVVLREREPRLESNFRTPTKPGSRCDQGSDCR